MSHTPGPWLIEGPIGPNVVRGHIHITDSPGFTVASITPTAPHPIMSETVRHANARLIAAAPELLEALKWAMENIGPYSRRIPNQNMAYCDKHDAAHAAIAKAEGK